MCVKSCSRGGDSAGGQWGSVFVPRVRTAYSCAGIRQVSDDRSVGWY